MANLGPSAKENPKGRCQRFNCKRRVHETEYDNLGLCEIHYAAMKRYFKKRDKNRAKATAQ